MASPRLGTWLSVAVGLAGVNIVNAQYMLNSYLFNQTQREAFADLTAFLKNISGLDDIYYPLKYRIPRDYYVLASPNRDDEYTQNVIFDPCKGYEYNCCNNTYGVTEYIIRAAAPDDDGDGYGQDVYIRGDDSSLMPYVSSRLPDDALFIDEACKGPHNPRPDCVRDRMARRPFGMLPRCWDRNETIVADAGCRAPKDGRMLPLCMEIGITQTAYIHDCGEQHRDDPHCGTYLEIHRPAMAEILSETRVVGMYASGYRMNVISLTYKRDAEKVMCYDPIKEGAYEVWWVQRTLYDWKVQRRLGFRIISPICDWDYENNRYLPYATLTNGKGVSLLEDSPFTDDNILFSRPRTESHDGVLPGPGMGISIVKRTPASYPPDAEFNPADATEYAYSPSRPFITLRTGAVETPTLKPGEVVPS